MSLEGVPLPTLDRRAAIVSDLGLAQPMAVVDIKDGAAKVFRLDSADGGALVLKAYDQH